MLRYISSLLILMLLLLPSRGGASGYIGTIGPTYPIVEMDMSAYIHDHLNAMQKSGKLAQIMKSQQNSARDRIINGPDAVPGISPAVEPATYYVDPSVVMQEDVYGENNTLLVKSGTRINPLDHIHLSRTLVFFDGTSRKQIDYVRKWADDPHYRLVMVSGSPYRLMQQWRQQVYFDQFGVLCERFQITRVPAIVSQEGNRLRVDVVVP